MIEPLFRDSAPDIEITRAEGNYIFDGKGRKYLDFMMGWCVGNAGWNKKTLMKAINSFRGPVYVNPTSKYKRWEILAKKLVSLMPGKDYTCLRATGGTESVELALKTSIAYNRRKKFIAFNGAYHGQSLACLSLVGTHEDKFGPYPETVRLSTEWQSAKDNAIRAIKKGDISAFISEPILCNLGVLVPPQDFFKEIQEACNDTDTVFIMDEVATGFGRTGKMFGFEHCKLKPDIVTIAKGFSSDYAAIGSTIVSGKVAESMRFDFSNYSTFGWHPVSVECALANMDYLKKLIGPSAKSGRLLSEQLSEFCQPEGKGLCIGFEEKNSKIVSECLGAGLIVCLMGNRLVLYPALDVGKTEIEKACAIIQRYHK